MHTAVVLNFRFIDIIDDLVRGCTIMINKLKVGLITCSAMLVLSVIASAFVVVDLYRSRQYNEKTKSYRRIVVSGITGTKAIPCDLETWSFDFKLIRFTALFFGAEIVENQPSYRYCIVKVSTAYYRILTLVYRIFGYHVTDDHLARLLLN